MNPWDPLTFPKLSQYAKLDVIKLGNLMSVIPQMF